MKFPYLLFLLLGCATAKPFNVRSLEVTFADRVPVEAALVACVYNAGSLRCADMGAFLQHQFGVREP